MEAEELIKKTREKADKMAHGNVFKTDFKVCELLKELADKIEELVSDAHRKS
tara:strand:- start:11400 stop:11555 length:156 start_codon:yes stop_codon:yes gene_type:complete